MRTYIIERCVDDVLNPLWAPVSGQPPILAADGNDAIATFRASPHRLSQWIKIRAVPTEACAADAAERRR